MTEKSFWILWKLCWIKGRNKPFMTIEHQNITPEARKHLATFYYARLLKLVGRYRQLGILTTEADFANYTKMKWIEFKPGSVGYDKLIKWKEGYMLSPEEWKALNPIKECYEL